MKTNKTILTISMKTKTAIECQECQGLNTAFVTMNPNVFGYHLKKTHGGMSVEAYEVKWVYGGVHPRCKTCESELRRPKGGFWTYCSKTCASKGENNPMYGKFGNASPNKGKVRTAEHRERYRQAAYKRFEDQPELIEKVRNHTIQRVMNGTFQKKGIVKQIDPVTGSEESYDSQWEADAVHWLISVIGYCDLTKQHDIRIPYLLSDDGKLVINMTKPMVHHLIETAERYGFVIVEEQLMKMKRGHFSPTKTVADEPFVVMKKFKPA